ncbi:type II secretion system protein GspE [Candidatus Marinamargulisbacteria bacterium SCGC AAA071-K20]|nr:type II secretion system protein GspE [Candidatus Marinamargulisbacteria bacterium SCGC AAA071-K20]
MFDTLINVVKSNQLVSENQLDDLVQMAKFQHQSLFKILLNSGDIEEVPLLKCIANQLGISYEYIDKATIDYRVARLIPEPFARENHVLALFQLGNSLTVALSDPFNIHILEELEQITKLNIDILLSPQRSIDDLLTHAYSYREQLEDTGSSTMNSLYEMGMQLIDDKDLKNDDNADLAHEAPIAKLVDTIISQAVLDGASDIHIEPKENFVKIRFRVDGLLKDVMSPPKKLGTPIISRLKVLANLDITETRKPQDGRITFTVKDKDIDFRVSTVRTINGEKMVLRILDKSGSFVSLDKLGLSEQDHKSILSLINHTSGILIVCGPTGSGKTSTLYSCLSKVNTIEKNIITIEDPVEFNLDGINQIPVNPKIGVDFITGLTALVRQDPDIIMVGEIRNFETANISIQAALTGHLVLTTLHTRTAAGAITRLVDMGVQPFLLNSSVIGVIGQRLVRTICPNCKKEVMESEYSSVKHLETLDRMKKTLNKDTVKLFKGTGCKFCDNTGYKGRIGIFEILKISTEIREIIIENGSSEKLHTTAKKLGMKSMQIDGFNKIINGISTLEEIARVLDVH